MVDAGQIIGLSGDTGLCTGEHLHFSLKYDGKFVDPEPFLKFIEGLFMYMRVYLDKM
jgi:murein DD-endopeptidase MepM/ murein hydrolase activator NlpD